MWTSRFRDLGFIVLMLLFGLAGCAGGESSGASESSGSSNAAGSNSGGPLPLVRSESSSSTSTSGSTAGGSTTGGSTTGTPSSADQPPTAQLRSSATSLSKGGSTTLSWSSTHADSCSASGGWGGSKATSGTQSIGPLDSSTTFTLSCAGAGGTAVSMVAVTIEGTLDLRWQEPTSTVDGSPLSGLAGYRIHYGHFSRDYTEVRDVGANVGGSYSFSVPAGTYYVAMTAVGLDGSESAYSNEVVKVIQ